MSSFFHGYLSESDDDFDDVKAPIVNEDGANEVNSDLDLNKIQSEKSDYMIACPQDNAQKKEIDHIIPETYTEPDLTNQISCRIGVKKSGKKKKKNKYLNEFLEISSLENIKTLDVDSLKKSTQEISLSGHESRVRKLNGDGELKQSVHHKRKHQITWLLNEARQMRSEFY